MRDIPTGIYTIPEISSVGETEESLQAKGIPYVVGKASFVENARANLIGVVTNGTAVLGLGAIGPLAAKPVMEGKAVLFKRFADVDAFDIEVDTKAVDAFVNCVRYVGKAFGGKGAEHVLCGLPRENKSVESGFVVLGGTRWSPLA